MAGIPILMIDLITMSLYPLLTIDKIDIGTTSEDAFQVQIKEKNDGIIVRKKTYCA
jgi:hypothetical protein